jgi:hypothetical protein
MKHSDWIALHKHSFLLAYKKGPGQKPGPSFPDRKFAVWEREEEVQQTYFRFIELSLC